eukprot:2052354-Rhodomonas_salina.1
MEQPIPVRPARPEDFGQQKLTPLQLQEQVLHGVALGAGVCRSLGQVQGVFTAQAHAHPRRLCPSRSPAALVLPGADCRHSGRAWHELHKGVVHLDLHGRPFLLQVVRAPWESGDVGGRL